MAVPISPDKCSSAVYVQEDQLCNRRVPDFSEVRSVQTSGYQSAEHPGRQAGKYFTRELQISCIHFTCSVMHCARLGTRFTSQSRLNQFVIGMSAVDLASS